MEFSSFKSIAYQLLGHCPNCGSTDVIWSSQEYAASNYFFNIRIISAQCSRCIFPFKTFSIKRSISIRPKIATDHSCPRCHEKRIYRSMRQSTSEKLASYIFIKPYRCASCYHRFHLMSSQSEVPVLYKKIIFLSLIAIILTLSPYLLLPFKSSPSAKLITPVQTYTQPAIEHKLTLSLEPLTILSFKAAKTPRHVLDQQIDSFIKSWQESWQQSAGKSADITTYLTHYAEDFTNNGLSKEEWAKGKSSTNTAKQWIKIDITNFALTHVDKEFKQVEVRIVQNYNSSNFSDNIFKKLLLKQEQTGWKIIEESELP